MPPTDPSKASGERDTERLNWLEDPASRVRHISIVHGDPGWVEITTKHVHAPILRTWSGPTWRHAIDKASASEPEKKGE